MRRLGQKYCANSQCCANPHTCWRSFLSIPSLLFWRLVSWVVCSPVLSASGSWEGRSMECHRLAASAGGSTRGFLALQTFDHSDNANRMLCNFVLLQDLVLLHWFRTRSLHRAAELIVSRWFWTPWTTCCLLKLSLDWLLQLLDPSQMPCKQTIVLYSISNIRHTYIHTNANDLSNNNIHNDNNNISMHSN